MDFMPGFFRKKMPDYHNRQAAQVISISRIEQILYIT
jgi:hypothetical protein